jgi:hypothetical protein
MRKSEKFHKKFGTLFEKTETFFTITVTTLILEIKPENPEIFGKNRKVGSSANLINTL